MIGVKDLRELPKVLVLIKLIMYLDWEEWSLSGILKNTEVIADEEIFERVCILVSLIIEILGFPSYKHLSIYTL